MNPLLTLRAVHKHYRVRSRFLDAVTGLTLDIYPGEVLGIVGESGSGKSTLGRLALGLEVPTSGEVAFEGRPLASLKPTERRSLRKQMQIVFQDPLGALNPRMTILDLVAEGLDIHGLAYRKNRITKAQELLEMVGLSMELLQRFPHELSGGQRQRICIARALAVSPRLLVCDEPLSALDLSVQAQIVNLLKELRQKMNLTYLFITHDLAMVRYLSDRIAVMHRGQLVELSSTEQLFNAPQHPHTQALIAATAHRRSLFATQCP